MPEDGIGMRALDTTKPRIASGSGRETDQTSGLQIFETSRQNPMTPTQDR
jgi:hypothetical protein